MKYIGLTLLLLLVFGVGFNLANPKSCGANCSESANGVSTISASDFENQVNKGQAELIDIRTVEEFESGHIAGAVNEDFYQTAKFKKYLESLDKDKKYLIYCRSGNRSGQALAIMKQMGFSNVSDLGGGVVAWQQAGLGLVK